MTPEQIVGELARIRRLSGLSQREVAKRIGTYQSTVSDWENGAMADLRFAAKWAESLGYRLALVAINGDDRSRANLQ